MTQSAERLQVVAIEATRIVVGREGIDVIDFRRWGRAAFGGAPHAMAVVGIGEERCPQPDPGRVVPTRVSTAAQLLAFSRTGGAAPVGDERSAAR